MGEEYKGQYAPDLFNEQKRYFLLQAQEETGLTDAELRDMHLLSNTALRRVIQEELGDSAIRDGFKIVQHPTNTYNNFSITGGSGTMDDPGVLFLKGYRLSLRDSIGYTDQTNTGNLTDDAYTKTILPSLNTPIGSNFYFNSIAKNSGAAVVVGEYSSGVLRSVDSGRNFSSQAIPYSSLYNAVFSDSTTVFAVGQTYGWGSSNSAILRSKDTGSSWANLIGNATFNPDVISYNTFYGIDFINGSVGYAVGSDGKIYYTVDSGGVAWGTWNSQISGTTETLRSISAFNISNVWTVGDAGTILYSSDSLTWAAQTSPVGANLKSVFAFSATKVFACGASGSIIRTTNAGSSWLQPSLADTTVDLNSIFFLDSLTGWAVGNGGTITKTVDGGASWDSTIINSSYDFNSIYFSDTTGFIVGGSGSAGVVYRTLDGVNWDTYRTDYVYIDFHLAEVSGDTTAGSEYSDPALVDVVMGLPSANRLRLVQDVKVSEGWPTPSDYTTSDGTRVIQHYTYTLATIQRNPGQNNIYSANISDARSVVSTVAELDYALKNGGVGTASLAPGSVTASKLDPNDSYTMGSLKVAGDTTIGGNLRVDGILYIDSSHESTVMDSLTVKGSTVLGHTGSSLDSTISINGSVIQVHDTSTAAYNLSVSSTASNAPVFNIQQDSSGTIMKIKKTTRSSNSILDVTSAGTGYDFSITHAASAGGIIKSFDDSTNTSYLIQKDATGSTAAVFDITTNSYGPAINIHNKALCDSHSIRIDQASGNALTIDASGDASSIVINSKSSGTDLRISHSGTSGYVMDVTSSGTGLLRALNTKGAVAVIKQQADADTLNLSHDSTGPGRAIEINHSGVDPALQINKPTGAPGISLHISHTGDSTSPAVDVYVSGSETGPAVKITKANNDSTYDVGQALYIINRGFSQAIQILHDNTDSTSSMLDLANYGRGYDASALNWRIDSSGNFVTRGDATASSFAFDSTFYLSKDRFFLDASNFDSSNPAIAGGVYMDGGFLRISDGTTQLDPVGGYGKTGLQGLTGIYGPPGSTGLSLGATGLVGVTGIQGNTGIYGLQGITGLALGTTGLVGITGLQGLTGIYGPPGSTGLSLGTTGLVGITGLRGFTGIYGLQGVTGVLGVDGKTGIQGFTGILGVNGQTGFQGVTGIGAGITGIQYATQLPLGNPPGGFSTGIFPWDSSTLTNPALDSVNALLLAISPVPPGILTGTLTLSNTTKYSAILPTNLSSSWYQNGQVAGSTITDYVIDNSYNLTNPTIATTFKVGSTFGGDVGTIYHVLDGTNASSRDVTSGIGITGNIEITDLATYNTIWRKANARINYVQATDGFRKHAIKYVAPSISQVTSDSYFWYDSTNGVPGFPIDATIAQHTLGSSRFLSGVQYYAVNDSFDMTSSITNLAKKAIHPTSPVNYVMPGMASVNLTISGASFAYDSTYNFSVTDHLSLTNVYNIDARLTVTATKPAGTSAVKLTASQHRLINTYSTIYSSNGNITMFDEQYRWKLSNNFALIPANYANPTGDWTSSAALSAGNGQLYNSTWYYPSINYSSGYLPLQSVDYSSFSGDQTIIWAANIGLYHSSMSIVFTPMNYTSISAESSGNLNMFVRLPTVTDWLDCGKSFGDGSGCRYDIGSSGTTLALTFGTNNSSGSNGVVFIKTVLKNSSAGVASQMVVSGT